MAEERETLEENPVTVDELTPASKEADVVGRVLSLGVRKDSWFMAILSLSAS